MNKNLKDTWTHHSWICSLRVGCNDSEFMSLYQALCLCFDVPCPSLSFKFLLCSPLCLPLSVVLFPSMFLLCAPPPLVTSPGLLPPLSSPVPRLIISVFPSLLVRSLYSVCICLMLMLTLTFVIMFLFLSYLSSSLVVCFGFVFLFELCLWFVLCHFVCTLSCFFVATLPFDSLGFWHSALL